MPYWQRQTELNRSLRCYRELYGPTLEISICDDGSPIPVEAPGCVVTYLQKKDVGLNPCVPMNRAVRASSRDIVVITGPEIEHREDVLGAMEALLTDENDYVMACCRDISGRWLAGPSVTYGRETGRQPVPPGSHFHFCAMLHRSLYERVGGFDEQYRRGRACEDNDFLWALHAAGARFKVCPKVVWHYRTPHKFQGSLATNIGILRRKWGHLWN